jgi:thymidylate synthase (FAD)
MCGTQWEVVVISDNWKYLREDCFGNTEPSVKLVAISKAEFISPEALPAISAGISYGTEIGDLDRARELNKKLLKMGHDTPFEAVQFNLHISSISKLCGAQLSRYRLSGHISASRRYRKQQPAFVYPLLQNIKDHKEVKEILNFISQQNERAYNAYLYLRNTLTKQDARYVIPASTATERHMWLNAREARHIFKQRLAPDAEPEIRRLAYLMLDVLSQATPSLFEDIVNDI